MRARSFVIPTVFVLASALGSRDVRADAPNEPTEENYDCSIESSCPESGVSCGSNPCFKDQQCPNTGVECDWRNEDVDACVTDAEASGLTLRCDGQMTVYCEASEAAPAGSDAECHAKQKAAGLEERCEDENFDVVYCDPGEESSTVDGGESGCAIDQPRRRSDVGLAIGVFGVAVVVTAIRARRRSRPAAPPRGTD